MDCEAGRAKVAGQGFGFLKIFFGKIYMHNHSKSRLSLFENHVHIPYFYPDIHYIKL